MEITITIETKEVQFDVANKLHLYGNTAEGDRERKALLQVDIEGAAGEQVKRSVTSAAKRIALLFAGYLVVNTVDANNNLLPEESDIIYTLSAPSNFDKAATDTITQALHDYIVYSAIADHLEVHNEASSIYRKNAEQARDTIAEAVFKRVRPERG